MAKSWIAGMAAVALMVVGSSQAVKAQPVPYTWTGCYIGGNGGFGWGDKTFQDANKMQFLIDNVASVTPVSVSTFGGVGGGQVGCDYQYAPNVVIGLRGMFDAAAIGGNSVDPIDVTMGAVTRYLSATTDGLFDLVGRLGYANGTALFYVDGGIAWALDKYSIVGVGSLNYGDILGQASETRSGGVVGAGFELALWQGWSSFVEYDHYFFGTKTIDFCCGLVNIRQDINTILAGVHLRFSGGPPPP